MRAKFSELTYDAGQQKSCCASKGCGQVEPWLTAEGIPVKGAYTAQDLEGMEHLELCGRYRPVPARPLLNDVRDAPVDDPPVCGFLDRRGVQRILPPQPGRRAEGSVGGIRPCYAPRLRRRPPARGGRRGQSRRVDLLGRGHEGTVQRHSARQDVGVDDHERRRAAHPGILHCDGSGAGLHARPAGRYDPERHPQGVHGA